MESERKIALAVCLLASLASITVIAQTAPDDYDNGEFGGSAYAQHGPGPAYGGAYANYGGRNTPGIVGRFNSTYGEYGAIPGYGELGAAAGYGTGANRGAGSGYGLTGRPGKTGSGYATRSPHPIAHPQPSEPKLHGNTKLIRSIRSEKTKSKPRR